MRVNFRSLSAVLCLGVAIMMGSSTARADELIALKSGETVELGTLFWVSNCRSLLNGPPVAEVMEGPPDVTVSVRAQDVIPHKFNCAKAVPGGVLLVTAPKEVKARTQGMLTIRVKYATKDGERQNSRQLNVTLFP